MGRKGEKERREEMGRRKERGEAGGRAERSEKEMEELQGEKLGNGEENGSAVVEKKYLVFGGITPRLSRNQKDRNREKESKGGREGERKKVKIA